MYGAYPYLTGVQSTPSSYYPDEYYEQGALRRDIDTLTGKTGANEYANAQLPVAPRTRLAPPLATVLVFSDRHIQEIRDYAIVGQTLWVLDEDQATKVSLNDLDLEGTIRLNQERGVAFTIPQ